jgi:hypothetical protein
LENNRLTHTQRHPMVGDGKPPGIGVGIIGNPAKRSKRN